MPCSIVIIIIGGSTKCDSIVSIAPASGLSNTVKLSGVLLDFGLTLVVIAGDISRTFTELEVTLEKTILSQARKRCRRECPEKERAEQRRGVVEDRRD